MRQQDWIQINLPWSVSRSVWEPEARPFEEEHYAFCIPLLQELRVWERQKFGASLEEADQDAEIYGEIALSRFGSAQFREIMTSRHTKDARVRKIRSKYEFVASEYCCPGVFVELEGGQRFLLGDILLSGRRDDEEVLKTSGWLETVQVLRCFPVALPW